MLDKVVRINSCGSNFRGAGPIIDRGWRNNFAMWVHVIRIVLGSYYYYWSLQEMEQFTIESCVRGHHVYKDIWEASIGEQLPSLPTREWKLSRSIWCGGSETLGTYYRRYLQFVPSSYTETVWWTSVLQTEGAFLRIFPREALKFPAWSRLEVRARMYKRSQLLCRLHVPPPLKTAQTMHHPAKEEEWKKAVRRGITAEKPK